MTAFRRLSVLGGIEEYVHERNGLRVLYCEQSVLPVVTVMITYLVGSADEGPGATGSTHFLEHLMFKGSNRYNAENQTSVIDVLQRVGAQVNATTAKDRTNYYATLPSQHFALAVDIEADRMRGALLSPKDLLTERTVILNELDRAENFPISRLYRKVWSRAFTVHPYHHPIIGWKRDVENASITGLRDFYDRYYWPDNAVLSIVGRLSADEALHVVDEHFGSIPRSGGAGRVGRYPEPAQEKERRIESESPGYVSALIMAYKSPPASHEDSAALGQLAYVLSHGKVSRLWRKLTDRGLTTSARTWSASTRDPGLFCIETSLVPSAAHAEVEAVIVAEVNAIQQHGVTEEETARARNQVRAYEAFRRDGTYGVASALNEAIAAGDWKLYSTMPDRLRAVTRLDIQRVARRYLRTASRIVAWHKPTA